MHPNLNNAVNTTYFRMELFLSWSLMIGCAFADSNDFFDHKQPARTQSCDCGWSNKGRIIDGKETRPNEYPSMVALQLTDAINVFCGGTILTPQHIVTAAHCIYNKSPRDFIAIIGAHNLNKLGNSSSQLKISYIIMHEKYDDVNVNNDISLLVVENPINFSMLIGPACLPERRIDLVGQSVRALGWGRKQKEIVGTDVLMEADLVVISIEECRNLWRKASETKKELPQGKTNLCTYHPTRNTYTGDSGGPLLWLDSFTNRYTIVGVISYGPDGEIKLPEVHTKIASYLSWIKSNIQKSSPKRKAYFLQYFTRFF